MLEPANTALRGLIRNGVVVLEGSHNLAEGTLVEVQVVVVPVTAAPATEPPTLLERLLPVVGVAAGLPADLAAQHDHYLYGTPKQS